MATSKEREKMPMRPLRTWLGGKGRGGGWPGEEREKGRREGGREKGGCRSQHMGCDDFLQGRDMAAGRRLRRMSRDDFRRIFRVQWTGLTDAPGGAAALLVV